MVFALCLLITISVVRDLREPTPFQRFFTDRPRCLQVQYAFYPPQRNSPPIPNSLPISSVVYEGTWQRNIGFRGSVLAAYGPAGKPMEESATQLGRYRGTNWTSNRSQGYPRDRTNLYLKGDYPISPAAAKDSASFEERSLLTVLNLGIGPANPDSFRWRDRAFEARSPFGERLSGRITAYDARRRPLSLIYSNPSDAHTAYQVDYAYSGILGEFLPDSFSVSLVYAGDTQGTNRIQRLCYRIKQWTTAGQTNHVVLNPRELFPGALVYRWGKDGSAFILKEDGKWTQLR